MIISHILATRPEPQQSELLTALARLGPEIVSIPAFGFEAMQTPPDLATQARGALLIFSSPRAVTYGLAALDGVLPEDARAAAIGPATRAELEKRGIPALQAPGHRHDSEALLAVLDDDPSPGRALLFVAPGGREALERGLTERGWQVMLAPVYRRVLLPPDPRETERLGRATGVLSLWTSGTAMNQVLRGLPEALRAGVLSGTAVVASDRLAALAREQGFARVAVAEGAANAALLAAVNSCLGADGA